ncbi:MAG TPA: glycoside hydrolase domain-containing protein [Planctomycetota bacterium]
MRWAALFVSLQACLLVQGADSSVVLNQDSYWRQYYRFEIPRISPAILRAEGQALLGAKGMDQARKNAESWIKYYGLHAQTDWQDFALLATRGAREFIPTPSPLPPADWTTAAFDDSAWVLMDHFFQGGRLAQVTVEDLGQYEETVDIRLQSAFYRARFLVDDPEKLSSLTIKLVYSGGARVFVNGREIGRGHLPAGELASDAAGADYDAKAYAESAAALTRRTLGPLTIPATAINKGCNVVAVEIRASHIHPLVLKNPIQPNWGGPRRPFPHARLFEAELRGASSGLRSVLIPPAETQVWVEDIHRRIKSTDFHPAGETAGTVRFVGAKNGAFCAQLVVRPAAVLTSIKISPSELVQTGGTGKLPATAISVAALAPYPSEEFNLTKLGDERGLNATFPSTPELARAEASAAGKPHIFDHIVSALPASIPAGAAQSFWLRLSVPADASPGTYAGKLEVSAQEMQPVGIPISMEVADWDMPAPEKFQTLVGCEENPYAVAKQYAVPLWSEKHFKLLEASFKELGRAGNKWLNVAVLRNTELGNKEDSPIRIVRKRDGSLTFDYTILDKYLDLAMKHCGAPAVVHYLVEHGMKSAATPPAVPEVTIFDEAGRAQVFSVRTGAPPSAEFWKAFGASLLAHMKSKGLEHAMFWGAPLETEEDPGLKTSLAGAAPGIGWTAGPHEMMFNGTYAKNEQFYRLIADIRYQGGWAAFRDDQGWKSKTIHLLNPRVGGTCFALHTTSFPFAFRAMPDHCLATGHGGFTRLAADDWASTHFSGMAVPKWLTGIPVLFLLWPGRDGAEPSVRFEALREGIQEVEARIFIEKALDSGKVPQPVAARARTVLHEHFSGTDFFLGNSVMHSLEQNWCGWQERSRKLFAAAAEVKAALK